MSTYYSYYFRAPLKDSSIDTVERFRDIAAEADIYFDIDSGPIHNVSASPYFGKSTVYEGPSFDVNGMDVSDGILRIGVFASNLERSDADYEDAARVGEPDTRTRIERLMEFLSSMTTGEVGEIHGTFGSEYIEYHHGHPILRCADGGLRILRTDFRDDYDWYHGEGDPRERYEGPLVEITSAIPADLVGQYEDGAFLVDIHDGLVRRLVTSRNRASFTPPFLPPRPSLENTMTKEAQTDRSFVEQWVGVAHPHDIEEIRRRQLARLSNPEFDKAEKAHDWRNHVGDAVRSLWHEFTEEQRAAIALEAERRATDEGWD